MLTFWQWLRRQHTRDDRVGDLARDARRDTGGLHDLDGWPRRARKLRTLDDYLTSVNACESAHESLRAAHAEWSASPDRKWAHTSPPRGNQRSIGSV
jgi:hypothetical protein